MRKFVSRNPFTGNTIKEFEFLSDAQVKEKIQKGYTAFKKYRNTSL